MLQVDSEGDVANAYDFSNGEPWEIDLTRTRRDAIARGLVLDVRPIRAGRKVLSDTAMAGRSESSASESGRILGMKTVLFRDAEIGLGG